MQKPLGGYQPGLVDIPDELVEEFIASHPNGGSVQEIANALGLTRERVFQLLRKALVKAQVAALRAGISVADIPCRTTTWDQM